MILQIIFPGTLYFPSIKSRVNSFLCSISIGAISIKSSTRKIFSLTFKSLKIFNSLCRILLSQFVTTPGFCSNNSSKKRLAMYVCSQVTYLLVVLISYIISNFRGAERESNIGCKKSAALHPSPPMTAILDANAFARKIRCSRVKFDILFETIAAVNFFSLAISSSSCIESIFSPLAM